MNLICGGSAGAVIYVLTGGPPAVGRSFNHRCISASSHARTPGPICTPGGKCFVFTQRSKVTRLPTIPLWTRSANRKNVCPAIVTSPMINHVFHLHGPTQVIGQWFNQEKQ